MLLKFFSVMFALGALFFPLAVSADVPADIPKARIAVLGGTFLNDVIFYREGIVKKAYKVSRASLTA